MIERHRDMEIYKPQSRVDHQRQDLVRTHGFTFEPFPKIPRPRQAPPIPEGHREGYTVSTTLTYGQDTMDVHNHTPHSQPSTVTSINSRSLRAANAATLLEFDAPNLYHQVDESQNSMCSKCHGIILSPLDEVADAPLPPGKGDNYYCNYVYPFHHPALQRNNSVGGFTLTGQDSQKSNKSCLSKVCSSHKIALVVSTFSFLVTIGLTITLILMKNKGMMEPM